MNRIKQIANLIPNCACVYDVGSDHALLAIDLLQSKKVKLVVNIEKNWHPHNAGKANLAKKHLTTKTVNVLNDGLNDITKMVFEKPNYVVIAGLGGKTIVDILQKKDPNLRKECDYILEANCDINDLRKYLIKSKWNIQYELVCVDRNKFYQIICAKQDLKAKKYTNFEIYFGKKELQKDKKTWLKFLKENKKKIEAKKLDKHSKEYASLYKALKATINEN